MDPDSTDQRRLTTHLGRVSAPHGSPDGTLNIFAAQIDGNHDRLSLDADGDNLRRVTDHAADGDRVL